MLSSVYTRHTRTRIFFFFSSCEPCLKNLQGPPLPFWSEWALITSCRLAEAWPWPQSRFKWWSSTTRFKKPRHISVLQLRNQSWNRCHHAEKQTLQGRHTLDELFLLLVGLSKGTFRCQNSIQQQLQTESDRHRCNEQGTSCSGSLRLLPTIPPSNSPQTYYLLYFITSIQKIPPSIIHSLQPFPPCLFPIYTITH